MLRKIVAVVIMIATVFMMVGCVEREIVKPQESAMVPQLQQSSDPVEIDWRQVYDGVDALLADKNEYPLGKYLSYMVYDDPETGLETLEMQWCVDDKCVGEDAKKYAEIVVKAFNDEISIQDFNNRKSGEGDYGGYFDTHPAVVVVYHEDAENNFQEAEVYQYIQEGSNAGIMEYIKLHERESMDQAEAEKAEKEKASEGSENSEATEESKQ